MFIIYVGCVHWVFVLVVSCGGHLGSVWLAENTPGG